VRLSSRRRPLHEASLTRRELLGQAGRIALAAGLPALPLGGEDAPTFNGHKVILDDHNKIIPWSTPVQNAYDHFLRLRWNFIKTKSARLPRTAATIVVSAILLLLCVLG
jgi:hypothetical protein